MSKNNIGQALFTFFGILALAYYWDTAGELWVSRILYGLAAVFAVAYYFYQYIGPTKRTKCRALSER